jgi:hypothetical protein
MIVIFLFCLIVYLFPAFSFEAIIRPFVQPLCLLRTPPYNVSKNASEKQCSRLMPGIFQKQKIQGRKNYPEKRHIRFYHSYFGPEMNFHRKERDC